MLACGHVQSWRHGFLCLSVPQQPELVDLLHQLDDLAANLEAAPVESADINDLIFSSHDEQTSGQALDDVTAVGGALELVGPTAEELESCKDLIRFDHLYFKNGANDYMYMYM